MEFFALGLVVFLAGVFAGLWAPTFDAWLRRVVRRRRGLPPQ